MFFIHSPTNYPSVSPAPCSRVTLTLGCERSGAHVLLEMVEVAVVGRDDGRDDVSDDSEGVDKNSCEPAHRTDGDREKGE